MSDSPQTCAVGRILGAFGLRGETKVLAGDAADLREGLVVEATRPGEPERRLTVESLRPHKNRLLVRFREVGDAAGAEALAGAVLVARVADLPPLPPGTYRDEDLIGLSVTDARLGLLGVVREVLHYPHADMLVVGDRSLLVPMLAAYGMQIDRAAATISTSLPEGFEDL